MVVNDTFLNVIASIAVSNQTGITNTVAALDSIVEAFDRQFGDRPDNSALVFREAIRDASRTCSSLISVVSVMHSNPAEMANDTELAVS